MGVECSISDGISVTIGLGTVTEESANQKETRCGMGVAPLLAVLTPHLLRLNGEVVTRYLKEPDHRSRRRRRFGRTGECPVSGKCPCGPCICFTLL